METIWTDAFLLMRFVFNVLIFNFLRHLDYLTANIPTTGGIGMYQNTPADMSNPAEVPMEKIIEGDER